MTLKSYLTRNGLEPLYKSLLDGAKIQVQEAKEEIKVDIKDDIKDDIKTEVISEIGDIKDDIKDEVIAEIGDDIVKPISSDSIDNMFNNGN